MWKAYRLQAGILQIVSTLSHMSNNLRKRGKVFANECDEKMFCNQEKLFNDHETPEWLREPFIKSGYREAYSTAWQCVQSLCYLHNQSFNIWSHLITSLYFMVRFGMIFSASNHSLLDPLYLPLVSGALGTIVVYSTSAIAHLFSCISKRAYKTGFYLDYAAISLYTFTSSQAMFFYTRPINTNWLIFQSPYLYLCIAALLCGLATYSCCKTGAGTSKFSTLFRTVPFLAAWMNTGLPFIAGVTFCSCHATTACLAFSACSKLSIGYYVCHVICTCLLGLVYSSRIPERLWTGKFDFFVTSHQLLHILAPLATEFGLRVVELSITQAKDEAGAMSDASLLNTLGLSVAMLIVNALIAIWFGSCVEVD